MSGEWQVKDLCSLDCDKISLLEKEDTGCNRYIQYETYRQIHITIELKESKKHE